MPPSSQLPFNFDAPHLPPGDRIPTNIESPKCRHLVRQDFLASRDYLIITGFSSLEFLLDFFREEPHDTSRGTRIVLGHEDLRPDRVRRLQGGRLSQEIIDYWLERGISVTSCGAVLHLIGLIETGKVTFRILQNLHAKIYVGEKHVILGSSNFSVNGLQVQREANVRVDKESDWFPDIRQVAEYYYEQGTDFNATLIGLLCRLLGKVTWQEALARGAALLIEGDWWKSFREMESSLREFSMWPSQEQGIGKALYILDNHGSVLVADPTGSGKTRLGAALHLALVHRLWASGRHPNINELLLSPPKVMENWQREYLQAKNNFSSIVSHGTLSSGGEEARRASLLRLRNAHILIVDEAHNFINKASNRSQEIAKSLAEHVILFTATPINRKMEDIFRLIELLDIDNFPEPIIELYKRYAFRRKDLRGADLEAFKQVMNHFVVRRTKRELNGLIDREPGRYLNALGNPCRYPRQNEQVYPLGESPGDVAIAEEINRLAGQLVGITRLQNLKHPRARNMSSEEQQDYLTMRLKSSAGLARHMVQDMMRSSTAALLEHLYGTEAAASHFDIKGLPPNKDTGDTIQVLGKLMGRLPATNLDKVELPFWLREEDAYRQICEEELERYEAVGRLAKQFSLSREKAKADYLISLLDTHPLVIGFDRHIISLYYFQLLLNKTRVKHLLVTGSNKSQLIKAKHTFRLGSQEKRIVGLFSDSMSEGVNLQGASAMIMLDMPTVVRLAEQRIGRIDRMDSSHPEVAICWPDDHEAFALKTDEKFFKTAQDVENILGGNFQIPDQLTAIRGRDAIRLRQEALQDEEQEMEDLLPDAFQAVEDLVVGDQALIPPDVYDQLRRSEARVFANVSVVHSTSDWAFFALEGAAQYAPRWLFIDPDDRIHTDLPAICRQLRHWLPQSRNVESWGDHTTAVFQQFVSRLKASQIDQLPAKKRRAILLLRKTLQAYLKDKNLAYDRSRLIKEVLQLLSPSTEEECAPDYDHFGQLLIRYFQPKLQELRLQSHRKVITLNSLGRLLKEEPIPDEVLKDLLEKNQWVRVIDRRVAACIVGVGEE